MAKRYTYIFSAAVGAGEGVSFSDDGLLLRRDGTSRTTRWQSVLYLLKRLHRTCNGEAEMEKWRIIIIIWILRGMHAIDVAERGVLLAFFESGFAFDRRRSCWRRSDCIPYSRLKV